MNGNTDKKYSFQVSNQAEIQTISVGQGQTILYVLIGAAAIALLGCTFAVLIAVRSSKKGKNKKK